MAQAQAAEGAVSEFALRRLQETPSDARQVEETEADAATDERSIQ